MKIANLSEQTKRFLYGHHNYVFGPEDDINVRKAGGMTPLMVAAQFDEHSVIAELLQGGADPNVINDTKETALMIAVRLDRRMAVDAFLKNPSVERGIRNAKNLTAFLLAVSQNQLVIVEKFISEKDKISLAERTVAVMLAATYRNTAILQKLLKAGFPNHGTPNTGIRPIMFSARRGHLDGVKAFIADCPQELNATDTRGNTSLMFAVLGRHVPVIDAMCKTDNLRVNATNQAGWSAIALARLLDQYDVDNKLRKYATAHGQSVPTPAEIDQFISNRKPEELAEIKRNAALYRSFWSIRGWWDKLWYAPSSLFSYIKRKWYKTDEQSLAAALDRKLDVEKKAQAEQAQMDGSKAKTLIPQFESTRADSCQAAPAKAEFAPSRDAAALESPGNALPKAISEEEDPTADQSDEREDGPTLGHKADKSPFIKARL